MRQLDQLIGKLGKVKVGSYSSGISVQEDD